MHRKAASYLGLSSHRKWNPSLLFFFFPLRIVPVIASVQATPTPPLRLVSQVPPGSQRCSLFCPADPWSHWFGGRGKYNIPQQRPTSTAQHSTAQPMKSSPFGKSGNVDTYLLGTGHVPPLTPPPPNKNGLLCTWRKYTYKYIVVITDVYLLKSFSQTLVGTSWFELRGGKRRTKHTYIHTCRAGRIFHRLGWGVKEVCITRYTYRETKALFNSAKTCPDLHGTLHQRG